MTLRSTLPVLVLLAAAALFLGRPTSASISGGAIVAVDYTGTVPSGGAEQFRFTVTIEPVMFRLLTMQNKYKLLRMRVSNATSAPLALSADRDRLELVLRDGAAVAALLNPQRGDPTFWDSLEAETRETLAYPVAVKGAPEPAPGARPSSPESLYIYALVPAAQVKDLPASFNYTIASLNQTVPIRTRPPAAR